eukprot:gb/GFBE01073050.1/.p1 GENE.gb/GFBE01073050.1/~~gb/GFBE01073050.1/.p1  ORF type:complete len:445 (+),score=118.56 gb/GFBE01073050.1/:1-1335(+)
MKSASGMARPLVAAAWLAAVADAGKLRTGATEGTMATAEEPSCNKFICSEGWAPKPDHHLIEGDSDKECCEKTCKLWKCGKGFKAHEDYANNIGSSDEKCCDKTCSIFSCDENFGVPDSKKDMVGTKHEECCEQTCGAIASRKCFGSSAPDPEKMSIVPENPKDCCTPSCATASCEASDGLIFDITHHTEPKPSKNAEDFCCERTCLYYDGKCPKNFMMDKSDKEKMAQTVNDDTFEEKCCHERCHEGICEANYVVDPTYQTYFVKDTPYGCCIPTCEAHICSDGWVKNDAAKNFFASSLSDGDCCEKTCALYECGPGWFNSINETKLEKVAQQDGVCCEPSCEQFICPDGTSLRPSASEIQKLGADSCCEPELCVTLRENRTVIEGDEHCNSISDEEKCDKYYDHYESDKVDSGFVVVPCYWNSSLTLCRMHDENALPDCSPM